MLDSKCRTTSDKSNLSLAGVSIRVSLKMNYTGEANVGRPAFCIVYTGSTLNQS